MPAAVLPLVVAGSIWYRRRRVHGWTLRANPAPDRPVAPPIRGTTDNHGHARWALMPEAQALWPGPNRSPGSGSGASPGSSSETGPGSSSGTSFGGVVVGEAYDPRQARGAFSPRNPATWGEGGRAPLLIDPCVEGSTHSLVVAGSGSFKTTSAVSTL